VPHDNTIVLRGFARSIIRRKARQLACRSGFTRSDRDDIEQDLTQKLIPADGGVRPRRGPLEVVRHHGHRAADGHPGAGPAGGQAGPPPGDATLHVLIDGDDGPLEFTQTIASDEHLNRTGRWRRSDAERAELALDTATVLAALPEDLRDLAVRLMDASPSQVARDLGVPRSTLQRRMERLRRHFEDAGLRDYR